MTLYTLSFAPSVARWLSPPISERARRNSILVPPVLSPKPSELVGVLTLATVGRASPSSDQVLREPLTLYQNGSMVLKLDVIMSL